MFKLKIETIEKISYSGKWVEFWFKGNTTDKWDESCKRYKLDNLIQMSQLEEDIANNGIKGIRIAWFYDSPNWEPFCIVAGRSVDESEDGISNGG